MALLLHPLQLRDFNPRAPYGARLLGRGVALLVVEFQSTRPIRGATRPLRSNVTASAISIHAPHTGRDLWAEAKARWQAGISIHAPHTGRDWPSAVSRLMMFPFQSTRPIRGATRVEILFHLLNLNFNPRAPYGARLIYRTVIQTIARFQSTRPIRGATFRVLVIAKHIVHFNPRAPYGARLPVSIFCLISSIFQSTRPIRGATRPFGRSVYQRYKFQSTRPIRGATKCYWRSHCFYSISIHAPHTGRDNNGKKTKYHLPNFNPRAPYGARLSCFDLLFNIINISIHAPHTGRDISVLNSSQSGLISIHAPHTGRDVIPVPRYGLRHLFQSTRPIRGATTAKSDAF